MARASFETSLRGSYSLISPGTSGSFSVADARYAKETTSGLQRVKPAGWVPPTDYRFQRLVYIRHSGKVNMRNIPNGTTAELNVRKCDGDIGGCTQLGLNSLSVFNDIYVTQGVPQAMVDQALIKARLGIKQQSVNLGVAYAERKRTAQLVGDTAMQLAKAVRQVNRGDFYGAARTLGLTNPKGYATKAQRANRPASRWLEYQYGWKPLLSDVYGSCDALARRDKFDWIVTSKGSTKENIRRSLITGNPTSAPYGYGTATGMRGCFVRIDAVPQNDLLISLTSLGVTNPLVVAWELVPYSFLIDWFLPVGAFLDSLDALLGYGPCWASVSRLEKVAWHHQLLSSNEQKAGYREVNDRDGEASKEYVDLLRTATVGVPFATFPRFKDPLSLGHMANGLSLLASAFGR